MSDAHDHAALLASAVDAARSAGALIRDAIDGDLGVTFKPGGKNDLVTRMDLASEAMITEMLGARHPDMLFLAEEGGGNDDLRRATWVIDPIDGTINYAHGIPIYSISIAAVIDGASVVGVVYDPSRDELFTAIAGRGAHLNGRPLRTSAQANLEHALLVTGFPYQVHENPYGCIDAFVRFIRMGIPIRRLGSAALDLAYLAAGRFDAYWEVALGRWDVAAGTLMVVEAGGIVGTYAPDDHRRTLSTDRMLATNAHLYEPMRRELLAAATQA